MCSLDGVIQVYAAGATALVVTCNVKKTEGRVPIILSLFFPLLPFDKSFPRSASMEV